MQLKHTPLHGLHQTLGAKLVPFAGYEMPVSYAPGIVKEHLHTREQAGLFDVSHMGQVVVSGGDAASRLERLLPVELESLMPHRQRYALLTNDRGGVRDDLMVTRWDDDRFYLVVNAACKQADFDHLRANLPDLEVAFLEDRALIALQGPRAHEVMAGFIPDIDALGFMRSREAEIAGVDCVISRSGYTGEDGFEISMAAGNAEPLARELLARDGVEPVGLGARDTLRMEAGMPLYGHELDEETTPVEAGLTWSISKSRRPDGEKAGGFPGADVILKQMAEGTGRIRVGLKATGRIPVRQDARVLDGDGNDIGRVTSGGFAPSVSAPIAHAFVDTAYSEPGMKVYSPVRGKPQELEVVSMPFVKRRYHRV